MAAIQISTPLTEEAVKSLKAGDSVEITVKRGEAETKIKVVLSARPKEL